MPVWLTWIAVPMVGFLIGYITNYLAIKMLFRPFHPHYLLGHQLPFTPGLIPKRKNDLAHSVAEAVSSKLMNKEVLEKSLLSADMKDKIRSSFDGYVAKLSAEDRTLRQLLNEYFAEDNVNMAVSGTKNKILELVSAKVSDEGVGEKISEMAVDFMQNAIHERLSSGFLGSMLSGIGASFVSGFQPQIADFINATLRKQVPPMVSDFMDKSSDDVLNKSVSSLLKEHADFVVKMREGIVSKYSDVISNHLPSILDAVNITGIIEERIKDMDVKEMEELILQVMNKELTAIVWLGAFLGFLMGFINLAFCL